MSLPKPNLDDKTFEQLFDEAVKLIPRYGSGWTNHNFSDPGITFIELFSWLTEISLYRINMMTDSHRLKYLKLLGIKPEPPQAAKIDLTFETGQIIHLMSLFDNRRTVVWTDKAGTKIYFELDEDITIVPLSLKKVIVNEGKNIIFDRTNANERSDLFYAPFGLNIQPDNEFYLGFDRTRCLGDPPDTLSFMCYIYEGDLEVSPGRHGNEPDYSFENSHLTWQYRKDTGVFKISKSALYMLENPKLKIPKYLFAQLLSIRENNNNEDVVMTEENLSKTIDQWLQDEKDVIYKPVIFHYTRESKWEEIQPEYDGTEGFKKKGRLVFKGLTGWVKGSNPIWRDEENTLYYWLQCVVNSSEFEYPPRIDTIVLNTVSVTHGMTIKATSEWKSNGLPFQHIDLTELTDAPIRKPVLDIPRFVLLLDRVHWKEVDDFDSSGPEDNHFVLNREKGEITFGDGIAGKVPKEGAALSIAFEGKNVWISTGQPYQVFHISYIPAAGCEPLKVFVDGEPWKEVGNFNHSGSNDLHFTVHRKKGEIMFGNGCMGMIPPEGAAITVNNVMDKIDNLIQYRAGGGEEGNLKAGLSWEVKSSEQIKEVEVINHVPATGGTGSETIDDTVLRFLNDMRTPYRIVTSEDIEHIAVNTPGLRVARAEVMAEHRDGKNEKEAVTVVVVPYTPFEEFEEPPEPSDGFINAVCRHLEKHRLLGTRIYVIKPYYVKVTVKTTILPVSGAFLSTVKNNVRNKLNTFLHPVTGWVEKKGWPLGRTVYKSEIYEALEEVEGVDCVINVELTGDENSEPDSQGNLGLSSRGIVYSGEHEVNFTLKERETCRG